MVNQVPDVWRHVHTLLSKNLRGEGEKESQKQIRSLLCLGLKADPLPHTHFRQIPLTNVGRKSSSPCLQRNIPPLQFWVSLVWASSQVWKREARKQFFLFFSPNCYSTFALPPPLPPYSKTLKCSFPPPEPRYIPIIIWMTRGVLLFFMHPSVEIDVF